MMVIGRLGTAFVAANAIVSVISRLTGNLIQGVSQASSVMVGNTLGRGQIREAERQGWAFLGIGILLGTLSAAIILLITEPVVGMYRLTEHDIPGIQYDTDQRRIEGRRRYQGTGGCG